MASGCETVEWIAFYKLRFHKYSCVYRDMTRELFFARLFKNEWRVARWFFFLLSIVWLTVQFLSHALNIEILSSFLSLKVQAKTTV